MDVSELNYNITCCNNSVLKLKIHLRSLVQLKSLMIFGACLKHSMILIQRIDIRPVQCST